MDNFQLIACDFNVEPSLHELGLHAELWKLFTARQDTPGSPHHDTECIVLRGPSTVTAESVFNDLEADWVFYIDSFPQLYALIHAAIASVGKIAKLGRVMVVNLKADGVIDSHFDEGAYAEYYDRFHLVLSSKQGNWFHCGGEKLHMMPGELWQFNHHKEHEVFNTSSEDRIHLIIDARLAGLGE